jgi:hypothetical protein
VRALLVSLTLALGACFASMPARATIVVPKAGQTVTQSDLLGYLFVPPQPGDWLRYDIAVNGNVVTSKTIGFGVDGISSGRSAFFEIRTQTRGLHSVPVASQTIAGGNIIWKMYVDAPDFNDSLRQYGFAGGIIEIGDSYFRLGGGPTNSGIANGRQSLQSLLLFGFLPMPDARSGTVVFSNAEDLTLGGVTLHAVHTVVDFSRRSLGTVTGLPQAELETWQTTDVPLGLVRAVIKQNGTVFSMSLSGFGRRSYREMITKDMNSVPYFPGS